MYALLPQSRPGCSKCGRYPHVKPEGMLLEFSPENLRWTRGPASNLKVERSSSDSLTRQKMRTLLPNSSITSC